MNSDGDEPAYGLYLNDSIEALQKSTVPLLYIYAAYDPDYSPNCGLLYHILTSEYEKMCRRTRLTYCEFVTTMKITMQTSGEFRKTFTSIKRVKVKEPASWKRKVCEKIVSVMRLFSKYFYFGDMGDDDVKKIVCRLLEWAADSRLPADVHSELRVLVAKIFADNKVKQIMLCSEIFEELRREYGKVYEKKKIEIRVTDRYLYALLVQATRVWPIQGFAVIFLKAILVKQLSRTIRREERKKLRGQEIAESLKLSLHLNSGKTLNDVISPICDAVEMDREINIAVKFIADHLPLIVQKFWCRNYMGQRGRIYMWLDMLAEVLTLYVVSVCSEDTTTQLEHTCDEIHNRFKRTIPDSLDKERLMNKMISIQKQITLARGHQWQKELNSMSVSRTLDTTADFM
uniref:MIF4G domain-containing protein n=1 Tax=Steinernema glaseri TaxID=37863 RepID=A0A1I7Y8R0_9BILA